MRIGKKNFKLRSSTGLTIKPGVRQVAIISSLLMAIIVIGWFAFLNFSKHDAHGAVSGDYRSKMSGNWSTAGTWEKYNGTSWLPATASPKYTNNVISILNGHTVTMTATDTVDQLVIDAGGQLTLQSGRTLRLNNGPGTDLDISGIFNNAGTVTITASANITYQSGAKYQHNFSNGGTIPAAAWNVASTCEIINFTGGSTAPSGLNQSFGNFTWNCTGQNSDIDLAGVLTTVNGNFTVSSTGSKNLMLAAATSTLTVGGNYLQSGGEFTLSKQDNANFTLTITGNFTQSGGTFRTVDKNNQVGTINVFGNWSHTGGTIDVNKNGSNVQVVFKKTGAQIFTASSNTVSGNVDFTVNSGSTLVMGNSVMKGRTFTLSAGGELQIGSSSGIVNAGVLGANGNIQTTTRNYNSGANYTYNGTAAQVTGDGLPAIVNNLTLNNSNGLTLTKTVAVSNIITLTSGKITTGFLNELQSTNSSPASIVGYSSSNYVIGLLRRTVAGSGTYDFPVGTSSYYESACIALSGATGFTTVLGSFTNVNPLVASLPLVGIVVNNLVIDKLLNYGYWTLTPNAPMTGGTYSVNLQEQGQSISALATPSFCVLKRPDALSSWQSLGTHNWNTQSYAGGVVTAARSGLTSFSDYAIAYGEYLAWKNPVLISGVDGQVNAIYKFSQVCNNVDAWVTILALNDGAVLNDIDHFSAGYDEAWQPYIVAAPNDTSSIEWEVNYKVAGTSTDTIMPYLAVTAIDVDGDGAYLREFVEATKIYSYAVDPATDLIIYGGRRSYRAQSTVANVANIDTARHQAMFQINHRNVSSFIYETGAISNYGATQIRQNSLYFKFFIPGNIALPVSLVSFEAKCSDNGVNLHWITESESNNDYFTIERSPDSKTFEKVLTQKGAGNSHSTLTYTATDKNPLKGVSYYRLKQTDFNGQFTYSDLITVINRDQSSALEIKYVTPSVFRESFRINFTGKENGIVDFMLTNISGQLVAKDKIKMEQGFNSYEFTDQKNLTSGIYFVTLFYDNKRMTYKVVKQ